MRTPTQRLSQAEFIALTAMIMATTALSIDTMLPAIPEIAAELTPDAPNRAQLMVTSFVLGLGIGTLFTGPLSDAFGRRKVVVGGAIIYIMASGVAWAAQSLELMLMARVAMGIGSSGPRVVAIAMTRDIYEGRDMAKIMSFIMLVFSIVPALAPTLGHYIILSTGWRGIFVAFAIFSTLNVLWLLLRQPETLPPENRRPLKMASIVAATRTMFEHRTARLSIFVQTLTFGMLFTVLSSTQQVFDQTFDKGNVFHLWFAGIAVVAASASILNANIVQRLGMRAIVKAMFTFQIGITLLMVIINLSPAPETVKFAAYVIWVTANFFQAGLTIGNLNALAMEEMGHIAGLAASVIAAVSTVGAVVLAIPAGLMFNGTPVPMGFATLVMAFGALWLTTQIKRPGEV